MEKQTPENILTPEQIVFLEAFAKEKYFIERYYLTGGTALSGFYYRHRVSEDLDFFTENEEVDVMIVQQFLARIKQKLRITEVAYKQYYGLHTFFLSLLNKTQLKVDFNYYPFRQCEKPKVEMGIAIDSIIDIAVNKTQSIATRTNARDFVDLYFIHEREGYSIHDLQKLARMKFDWYTDPIQLGKQFLKVRDLRDYPNMTIPLEKRNLVTFFESQAREIGKDVIAE